jgi:arylformamidase
VKFLDISMPIEEGMATFPRDPEVRLARVRRVDQGAPFNLSSISMGSHSGTHIDPPGHFIPDGTSIDEIPLEVLNGPVQVVHLPDPVRSIGSEALSKVSLDEARVLFRTSNSERWHAGSRYFEDFVGLDPSGAEWLLERGVRLVGVDALSIERDLTGGFPVHRRLLGAGTLILEGLLLGEVPRGSYELRCLPLRLRHGDGGPCRAVLLRS